MSLALQLAQQVSAEHSVIAPWMYAVVWAAIILLVGSIRNVLKQNRSS